MQRMSLKGVVTKLVKPEYLFKKFPHPIVFLMFFNVNIIEKMWYSFKNNAWIKPYVSLK